MLRGRKAGEIGRITARMVPIVFPGVSPDVFHGFTAFTMSPTENTTEAVLTQSFHEIGLYQVEAGLRTGPAPNQNPNATYNNWGKQAGSPLVRQLLGRSATMVPNAWKTALEDQIAVGLVNLRKDADDISRQLVAGIRPDPTRWSNWRIMLAFTAFSRGVGQAKAVFNAMEVDLSGIPEDQRWRAARRTVALSAAQPRPGIAAIVNRPGKTGAAYALVRTEQKYESGKLLAQNTGDASWFTEGYTSSDDAIEQAIAATAYGSSLTGTLIQGVKAAVEAAELVGDLAKENLPALVIGLAGATAGVYALSRVVK